jgi:tRNA/tmRNA/rRNA uracil-C5-methylase (TrmA/RlmC/RlmD family)
MAEDLHNPPTLARAREYFEDKGIPDFAARTGSTNGWRTRAKLAVRSVVAKGDGTNTNKKSEPLALGLFARGTHDLVEIPECVVHHPRINQAAAHVTRVANQLNVAAYDEVAGTGKLRYVQLTAVADESLGAAHLDADAAVQVALVWNSKPPAQGAGMPQKLRRFVDALFLASGDASNGDSKGDSKGNLIHSVWVNYNDSSTNEIVNTDDETSWEHACGSLYQWSKHGDARVCYVPGSFLQANTEAYEDLLDAVKRHIPKGCTSVSELYAGAGAIGLSIAASDIGKDDAFNLRCVEIVEANRETFEMSAMKTFGKDFENTISFRVASAGDAARDAVLDADAVVVDPPRKGLDPMTLAALIGHAASSGPAHAEGPGTQKPTDPRAGKQGAAGSGRKKRNKRKLREKKKNARSESVEIPETPSPPERLRTLIYVSCGFKSFERDCDALLESKEWILKHAEGFNFFPGSDAVETLAVFQRVAEEKKK